MKVFTRRTEKISIGDMEVGDCFEYKGEACVIVDPGEAHIEFEYNEMVYFSFNDNTIGTIDIDTMVNPIKLEVREV
jgi:hypothetical protein